jgi:hypothetical protein
MKCSIYRCVPQPLSSTPTELITWQPPHETLHVPQCTAVTTLAYLSLSHLLPHEMLRVPKRTARTNPSTA